MHKYFIKTPWVVKKLFSSYIWSIPTKEKVVYLTFDDGPHPQATVFVLEQLQKYNAKATFFCIGKNVVQHKALYERILAEGHAVGNHTYNHLNGWKTDDDSYLKNIEEATACISSHLFRPPYGRIRKSQAKRITAAMKSRQAKIIMWDVLSADFDVSISKDECLKNVLMNYSKGSVIVFHDSEKAFDNLKYVLPKVLEELDKKGYRFDRIEV